MYISIYQYQSRSFRGLPAATRKRVGTVWGSCRCHTTVLPCVHFADYNYEMWNVDGGPNNVLRPKKVIQQYWEIDKRKSRPQALAKQKIALGETSSKVTSHPKDLSPASASFPCCCRSPARLFMEVSVSGWFTPRCASRPARARRCRASAWRLGMMASVVWGPRPGSACEYYVSMWERKKDEQWLCVWIDEKDVKYNCAMKDAHIIQSWFKAWRIKHKGRWVDMFNKIWMWVIFVPIFPLWKNPNSEKKKNHPTIPGNKKNLQASSLGQTKKCPWWNVQESHLSPQRPQPATDPREPGGARLRSNAKWQERGCICKITSLVFIELGWQHYPVGDFRSHAVPCWYSESWKFFRFDELFWECDKGWLYFQEILLKAGTWSGGVGNKSQ